MFTVIEYLEWMSWSPSVSDNIINSAINVNARLQLQDQIATKSKLCDAHRTMNYQNTRQIIAITVRTKVKFNQLFGSFKINN